MFGTTKLQTNEFRSHFIECGKSRKSPKKQKRGTQGKTKQKSVTRSKKNIAGQILTDNSKNFH